MANLVICADGTWNTPDDKEGNLPAPTNVVKLYNALPEEGDGSKLKKYYHPGVGTEGSTFDRLVGGGVGKGLGENVMSAYKWLGANYKPGDNIFLFGFSRGAFTVRSLGGMITCCGLLDLAKAPSEAELWQRVRLAFECYRDRRDGKNDLSPLAQFKFHNATSVDKTPKSTPIHFIGVWDTVGALGVPDDLALLNLIDDPRKHDFHDTELGGIIRFARHAVAMDEMRQSFAPTLWTKWDDKKTDVKQIWFAGVHGDVGGGYFRTGLSDAALQWMIEEAEAPKVGLKFRTGWKKHVKADAYDVLHDSCTGIFSALKTEPRQVPHVRKDPAVFHPSAAERHGNPPLNQDPFWPTKALKVRQSETVAIFARERWNATKLFLEKGAAYQFEAQGEWLDRDIPCGPGGTADGDFRLAEVAHLVSSALGKLESPYRWIANNPKADFVATKRVERHPWMALIGMVASGAISRDRNSNLPENELFLIREGTTYEPEGDGYLYCFANDAWHAYDNNRGSVSLTVTRTK